MPPTVWPVTQNPSSPSDAQINAKEKADAEKRVKNVMKYLDEAKKAVGNTGWDPLLLLAMAARESSGNPNAGEDGSYKGLVQLGKSTWNEAVNVDKKRLSNYKDYGRNWSDPLANLSVAATALKIKSDSLGIPDDNPAALKLTLLAYNGGQGAILTAIKAAKAAGEKGPYAAAATDKYLS